MNVVTVEGVVRKTWKYGNDFLFRLQNGDDLYVVVRVKGLPVRVESGAKVLVSGGLRSRQSRLTLKEFLAKARSDDNGEGELPDIGDYNPAMTLTIAEIVAREIRQLA